MGSELLKPALYREEGSAAPPALLGGQCRCGYTFFPMQRYGCERCGSVEVAPRALSGSGTLLASARVHLHAGKARQAPFTVGSIALADGPIVRTILIDDDAPFRPGDRVVTQLTDVRDADGNLRRDLRFRRAG